MKAAIIVIGDEILLGQVNDTNTGTLARMLSPEGIEIERVITIGDNADEIYRAVTECNNRYRLTITTGGLGPTRDDITKSVMLRIFGGEMREDAEVMRSNEQIMARRGLTLNQLTRTQAMVPSSCRVIVNQVGTAPIMWFEREGNVLVTLPGVPFEMRTMMERIVLPEILRRFGDRQAVEHRNVIVAGMSESAMAERIKDWEVGLPEGVHLAYLPRPGIVRLRLDATVPGVIDRYHSELIGFFGDNVIAEADMTVPEILLQRLRERGLTIATAESCTGGNIARELTQIPGSSDAYVGSVVSYSNDVKTNVLGVPAEAIRTHGAVSREVVTAMAEGVRRLTGADLAIATSGIAGPGGGSEEKPVGTVWMAVAKAGAPTRAWVSRFPGDRHRVIDRASMDAMTEAIRTL